MGSSATTYGPCSITICKRAGQITLKSEQLHREGWTAGTRPSRQRIIVAWAGSHHRSKVDGTGEGRAHNEAQRAGSLDVPCQL